MLSVATDCERVSKSMVLTLPEPQTEAEMRARVLALREKFFPSQAKMRLASTLSRAAEGEKRRNLLAEQVAQEREARIQEAERRETVAATRREHFGPSLTRIRECICEAFKIGQNDFESHRRHRYGGDARTAFYKLSRELTSHSFPTIGKFTGGRDHSTVQHGWARINEMFPRVRFKCGDDLDACVRVLASKYAELRAEDPANRARNKKRADRRYRLNRVKKYQANLREMEASNAIP